MDHVVIVCGYGCHLVTPDSRDTPLKNYLDRVVQFLNTHRPSAVVLCGGYTQQKSAPGVSEAALMRDYITPGLHEDYNPAIRLEEDSYTTRENIEGANFIIQKIGTRLGIYARHVTIFCEAQRALKVALIARHYFSEPGRVQIETVSWELAHPRREIISTLKELVGLKVPLFARYLHHQRLKQAAVI